MPATTVAVSSGNAQVGQISAALALPLAVIVTDGAGAAVAGVVVAWSVGAGAGALGAPTSITGADGIATNTWTLGPATGPQVVTAVAPSTGTGLTGSPVTFTATATLVTVAKAKSYLRIETDAEDDLIADLIVRAEAEIEVVVGQSLTKREVVWIDDALTLRIPGAVVNLLLGSVPIDEETFVVTDGNGDVVDPDTYQIRQDIGQVCARGYGEASLGVGSLTLFGIGPYRMTCTAGFATGANYATRELPMIQASVIDYVGMLYQQRTPGASTEGASGTRVTYEVDEATGLPKRIARALRKLRGIVYGR